jgi:hypothetical protein
MRQGKLAARDFALGAALSENRIHGACTDHSELSRRPSGWAQSQIPGRARQTTNATDAASVSRRPFVLTAHHHVLQPDRLDQPRHQPGPAAVRRCSLARPTITSTSWQDGGPRSNALDSLVGGAALSQRA